MNELMLFCFMGLSVFFVIVMILRSAGEYKSYYASPDVLSRPSRDVSKPFRSKRAQDIWNRLNPKIYMDDDPTEPAPQHDLRQRVKQ